MLGFACAIDTPPAAKPSVLATVVDASGGWRRTASGWERQSDWPPRRPYCGPWLNATQLHPAMLATFQVLVSMGALILFSDRAPASTPERRPATKSSNSCTTLRRAPH
jgi:hypothetical protein